VVLGFFVYLFNQANPSAKKLQSNPDGQSSEIFILLAGLALISSGGVVGLPALWKTGPNRFDTASGLRLVLMGDLVGFISGLAIYWDRCASPFALILWPPANQRVLRPPFLSCSKPDSLYLSIHILLPSVIEK